MSSLERSNIASFSKDVVCHDCGAILWKDGSVDITEHVAYKCEKRLINCPLKCGVPVRFNRLDLHQEFCPNRMLRCDLLSNLKCCHSPLKDYFCCIRISRNNSAADSVLSLTVAGSFCDEPSAEADVYSIVEEEADNPVSLILMPENTESLQNRLMSAPSNGVMGYDFPPETPSTAVEIMEASAIEVEGRLEFRPKLRLLQCAQHGSTALMAAIRQEDIRLVSNILKRTKCPVEDLDIENKVGDTALTLACRYGRLECVRLLLGKA